jgi:hypothetical protein
MALSGMDEGARDWPRLMGTAPIMINIHNKPRGKRPPEKGFINAPLD